MPSEQFSSTQAVALSNPSVVWKVYCACGGRVGYKDDCDPACLSCGKVLTQRERATMAGDGFRWEKLDLSEKPGP